MYYARAMPYKCQPANIYIVQLMYIWDLSDPKDLDHHQWGYDLSDLSDLSNLSDLSDPSDLSDLSDPSDLSDLSDMWNCISVHGRVGRDRCRENSGRASV